MDKEQQQNGRSSEHGELQHPWSSVQAAINDLKFVEELPRRCARFSRNPNDAAAATLEILCRPTVMDRYRPDRGTVMGFALGIARRVDAAERRRDRRLRTDLPLEPHTESHSIAKPIIVREQLSRVLTKVRSLPTADQELIWRAARARYWQNSPPLTRAERAKLYRLRKLLAEAVE